MFWSVTRPSATGRIYMVNQESDAIRTAYADLLTRADAAYHATAGQLADVRGGDAEAERVLTLRLGQTTELIDLLESAVAQAIDNLAATEQHPVGHG